MRSTHERSPVHHPVPCCLVPGDGRPDRGDTSMSDEINHPAHYGGDSTYEAIKVIEAWDLGFNLGNAVKYVARAGKKGSRLQDLQKAAWYLNREIENTVSKSEP
jgi:hypothetical protein